MISSTNWNWSNGNGFTSTLQNPGTVTAPATAGTYSYTVTASHSANASCTATATAVLTVSATVSNITLSLKKIASKTNPVSGDTVTFTVIITNAGPNNATGVKLKDILPTGLTFVSVSTGVGSYNSSTGIWDIGNVPVGQTTVTMIVTVN